MQFRLAGSAVPRFSMITAAGSENSGTRSRASRMISKRSGSHTAFYHTIAFCMDIWEVSHNNLPVVSQLELPEKLYLLQQKLSIGVQKRIATKILKLLEVIIGNVQMELIYGIT